MNSNAVTLTQQKADAMWETQEGLAQIRDLFAPTLTQKEFTLFTEMGKATGLNPFLREIWAVKYDAKQPAQIFVGRDGYRKSAQRHPLYDFHSADAVYSNDEFAVEDGKISHKYKLQDRGILVGGYCVVHRKGSTRGTYVFVEYKEYNKKQSTWNSLPATMIKKVAEAQALKMAFQELFAGTYSEYEAFDHTPVNTTVPGKGVNGLKERLNIVTKEEDIVDVEVEEPDFDKETGEVKDEQHHEDTLSTIEFLMDSATSKKELMEAMKMAKDLPAEDKKKVSALFNKRQAEIKG